jgi:hypothetical protein
MMAGCVSDVSKFITCEVKIDVTQVIAAVITMIFSAFAISQIIPSPLLGFPH